MGNVTMTACSLFCFVLGRKSAQVIISISPTVHDLSKTDSVITRAVTLDIPRVEEGEEKQMVELRWMEVSGKRTYVTCASGDECHYLYTFSDRVMCGWRIARTTS